jgi:hypothetical protein
MKPLPIRSTCLAAAAVAIACALPPRVALAQSAPPVDAATRTRVVTQLAATLERAYLDAAQGATLARGLRAHLQHGDYDAVADAPALADRLNADLEAAHDLHLHVDWSPEPLPPAAADGRLPDEIAADVASMKRVNYGIDNVDRLRFNVGYLQLSMMLPAERVAPRYAAMMSLVGDTRALVIDLRENHGGEPDAVALLASYLFDERTHLNDFWFRAGNRTEQTWTTPVAPALRYGTQRRLVVLTSRQTMSAAEDLAYALKNLKRATLVGETTGGAAHQADAFRLDDHFQAAIPNGRPVSPVTHGDWEGTGVAPDLAVPAERALVEAQKLLLREFAAAEKDPAAKQRMEAALQKM